MEAKLHTIKSLNDAYGGKQLTFFSLEDCSVSGVDHPELSSSLLEAIVQMHGASAIVEALSADLKVGTSIRHPKEGLGQIVQILPDGRRLVRFWENDKRNEECYAPQLLHHMIVDSSDSPYALRTDSFSTESQSQRSKQNNAMARTLELTVVRAGSSSSTPPANLHSATERPAPACLPGVGPASFDEEGPREPRHE